MPNYWMVVQTASYQDEIPGGFLWAPITDKRGAKLSTYTNMKLVKKGDVIFSLVNPKHEGLCLYAVGTCTEEHVECDNPLTKHQDKWIKEGWMVKVAFTELETKHKTKDHIEKIRPLLPEKNSPMRPSGEAAFSCYLHAISEELANVCISIIGDEYQIGQTEDDVEDGIQGRTDIGITVKSQLVNSRRGQGTFKENVFKNEKACRITGVTNPKFLIASHIKPWSKSTDEEKLDGCNGLLLTPSADKLFDKGFISFGTDGSIMVSSLIDNDLLLALGIDRSKNVGKFSKRQCLYLEYHQKNVFKK